jgi:hypothetical protein
MNMDVKNNGLETFGKQTVWRKSDFWGRDWREHEHLTSDHTAKT